MRNTFFAKTNSARRATAAAAALALLGGAAVAGLADPPVTMAPPVSQTWNGPTSEGYGADNGGFGTADASRDTVFNWQEVPQDQQVPLTRAVFDQGGYQLYDTVGETIVVPFTGNNLYVMKFAVSPNGRTFFVNTGDAPVLYIPRGSSLENAAVPGARWYPFSEEFHPAEPVFLGIAPSWDDYCAMGWYPRMAFYGGYWSPRPFAGVGLSYFSPSFGLSVFFGGHHYDGWEPYHRYYYEHPAPYHVTVVNNNYYRFGGRPRFDRDGGFRGAGRSYSAGRGFDDRGGFGGNRGFENRRVTGPVGGRVFNGTGRPVYAHRDLPGDRNFETSRPDPLTAGHAFNSGGRTFHGAGPSSGGRAFGGGPNTDRGRFDGARPFGGSRPAFDGSGARPTPSGETARPAFGGGRAFGGDRPFGGGRSAGGDARPAFHGGDRGNAGGGARPASAARERPASTNRDDHAPRR